MIDEIENRLLSLINGKFSSIHLDLNDECGSNYQTVAQLIEDEKYAGPLRYDWVSDDSRKRAGETNRMWVLQWYPRTPVGFNAIAAATLAEIFEWIDIHFKAEMTPA